MWVDGDEKCFTPLTEAGFAPEPPVLKAGPLAEGRCCLSAWWSDQGILQEGWVHAVGRREGIPSRGTMWMKEQEWRDRHSVLEGSMAPETFLSLSPLPSSSYIQFLLLLPLWSLFSVPS